MEGRATDVDEVAGSGWSLHRRCSRADVIADGRDHAGRGSGVGLIVAERAGDLRGRSSAVDVISCLSWNARGLARLVLVSSYGALHLIDSVFRVDCERGRTYWVHRALGRSQVDDQSVIRACC